MSQRLFQIFIESFCAKFLSKMSLSFDFILFCSVEQSGDRHENGTHIRSLPKVTENSAAER
jgi:hypothetical protein